MVKKEHRGHTSNFKILFDCQYGTDNVYCVEGQNNVGYLLRARDSVYYQHLEKKTDAHHY